MKERLKALLRRLCLLGFFRGFRDGLCRLLDFVAGILARSLGPRDAAGLPEKIERILAIRLDRIGDVVLTTPALRAVKESWPQARLAVMVRRYTKDLIEGLGFIDEVIVFDDLKPRDLVRHVRGRRFDVSLGFHPDPFANYFAWKCAIPCRIGYACCGSGLFLTQRLSDDRDKRIRHEVESALEVVSRIGAKAGDISLSIAVRQKAEEFAEDFFEKNGLRDKNVVVIHPGSRQSYIRWDKGRFTQVADRLVREKGAEILWIGSKEEETLVGEVQGLMEERSARAVGLPLAELVSVIKQCAVFIGNSTGPMHIAAALKVPVVAVFGAVHPKDSPAEWWPWGEGHIVVSKDLDCRDCHPGDCRTLACMEAVSVEDVFEAAVKLLRDGRKD